jgi:mannan endo-1,4-beta-mannosidase
LSVNRKKHGDTFIVVFINYHYKKEASVMKYQKKLVSVFVIALVVFSFPLLASSEVPDGFVIVNNDEARFEIFHLDPAPNEVFYFVGTNNYWLMQQRAYGSTCVDAAFDSAVAAGVKVIRTWGFADGYAYTNPTDPVILQRSPGVYEEHAFQAMDYVIWQAREHGIKLIITLVNNWDDYGGMNQYVAWAGLSNHDDFYTDDTIKGWYKNYLHNFVNRPNFYSDPQNPDNRILYKDDPTIMAWELANEAQMTNRKNDKSGLSMAAWYDEMSTYLKSEDPNHLVGTGEEGFAVEEYLDAGYYYSGYENTWALRGSRGTGFLLNTALENIDYGGAHLWPFPWRLSPIPSGNHWIRDHTVLARNLPDFFNNIRNGIPEEYKYLFPAEVPIRRKPVIIGEFGDSDRSVYASWLDTVYNEGTAGALLWELNPDCRSASKYDIQPSDGQLYTDFHDLAIRMNDHDPTVVLRDTVQITKVDYNARKDKLIVEATSTRGGTAFLEATYVYGSEPDTVTATMFYNDRKDNYKLTATNVPSDPVSVRVTSSFGGVDPPLEE